MNETLILDAAAIGSAIAFAMQLAKALPREWLETVLGDTEEQQKARIQIIVFVVTLGAVCVRAYAAGMFHVEHFTDIFGMMAFAISTAYATYQAVLKRLADKMPKLFKM